MKRIIVHAVIVLAVLAVGFIIVIKRGLNRLRLEDEVPHTFGPVVRAILDFEETNGVSPHALSDLVPRYVESVPASDSILNVHYVRARDQTNWLLAVTSQVGGDKWLYCWRTDTSLSWPDGWDDAAWIHGWHVFKKQTQ